MSELTCDEEQLGPGLEKQGCEHVTQPMRRQVLDACASNGRFEMALHEVSIVEWPPRRAARARRKAPWIMTMNSLSDLFPAVLAVHPNQCVRNVDGSN